MCTVTLLPLSEHSFVLTSNRDEDIERKTIPPSIYYEDGIQMLYPKDQKAGGTWIGISDRNRVICLLNGGFENHKRTLPYRKSRGTVVIDLLKSPNFLSALDNYDFVDIEPFTLVVIDWSSKQNFFEVVWDGRKLHKQLLDRKLYVWSSSTLYTSEMKEKREKWLHAFERNTVLDECTLLDFHKYGGEGYKSYDLQMDRGGLKTKSITQIHKTSDEISMRYEDLQKEKTKTVFFESVIIQ